MAATANSGAGNYKATPLAASSTWEAGGSSGSFTWSYPLRVPPAAAGPQPDLSISYDSGSVDDRTANTNNQGSQIGEGFDLTSSYVERSTDITSKLTPSDRVHTVKTTFDDYGMAETVEDEGDDAVKDDEKCTRTW